MMIKSATAPALKRRFGLALKAEDMAEDGTFTGYGSVFGHLDSYGDITVKGAFAKSIAAKFAAGTKPRMLWNHDPGAPCGSWASMVEDDYGLKCSGRLVLDVQKAREAYALMKAGEVMGLSIGFETVACEFQAAEDVQQKYGFPGGGYASVPQVRVLTEIDLWEVSLVTFAACDAAMVDSVKRAPAYAPDAAALAGLSRALAARAAAVRSLL